MLHFLISVLADSDQLGHSIDETEGALIIDESEVSAELWDLYFYVLICGLTAMLLINLLLTEQPSYTQCTD